jgi:hypothetical protein
VVPGTGAIPAARPTGGHFPVRRPGYRR